METMTAAEFRALMRGERPDAPDHGNRKIRNATKSEQDGVRFDSKLERYMYNLLKVCRIDFVFQKTYILQEPFRYNNRAVKPITLTVDFEIPAANMIIDTKGHQTQQSELRFKMLKKKLTDAGRCPQIELPQDEVECEAMITKIHKLMKTTCPICGTEIKTDSGCVKCPTCGEKICGD